MGTEPGAPSSPREICDHLESLGTLPVRVPAPIFPRRFTTRMTSKSVERQNLQEALPEKQPTPMTPTVSHAGGPSSQHIRGLNWSEGLSPDWRRDSAGRDLHLV